MSKKKIASNIFWLLTEHGVGMLLGLVATGILARQLGVEQYGFFQYAISLIAVFSSISFICGAEVLVPMLTTLDNKTQKEIIGNAFFVRLFFSVIAFFAFVLFAFFTEERKLFYLTVLLGTTLLFKESFAVVRAWLQSQTNTKPRSILVMLALVIKVSIMGLLFFYNIKNPLCYATVYVIDPLMVALGLLLIFYKKTGQTFFCFSFSVSYGLFRKGLPFFWGLLLMLLFMRADLLVIKQLSTTEVLGHYAAARQLFNQVNAIAPILVMSLAPLWVYRHNDISLIRKNTIKIAFVMFIIALMGAAFVQILAPYIIPLLFGANYMASIPVLCSLVWVSCLIFVNQGLNIYLLKMELGYLVSLKWLLALVVSFPAYWFLVPNYQITGVIVSYSFGYVVACLLGVYMLFNADILKRKNN